MFHNRKIKVFKVASPIFLMICLVGCGIMYLEMAAIFPILDMYACIATKWTRHMGKHWLKVFHSIIDDREQIWTNMIKISASLYAEKLRMRMIDAAGWLQVNFVRSYREIFIK